MLARKLKSNRGMSIIMGLLLLLVCAMAGAAALTSAASNAGRYTHMRQDQQRYLAVASAARLVRDELCAGEYTAEVSLTKTYEYSSSTDPVTGEVSWTTDGPYYDLYTPHDPSHTAHLGHSSYTGTFGPWLEKKAGEKVGEEDYYMDDLFLAREVPADWWGKDSQTQPDAPAALERKDLSITVNDSEPLLSQVKWTLMMGEDYSLYAVFWLEDTDKDGKVSTYYTTTLTIPADAVASESTDHQSASSYSRTITTQTLTVKWPAAGAVIRQS